MSFSEEERDFVGIHWDSKILAGFSGATHGFLMPQRSHLEQASILLLRMWQDKFWDKIQNTFFEENALTFLYILLTVYTIHKILFYYLYFSAFIVQTGERNILKLVYNNSYSETLKLLIKPYEDTLVIPKTHIYLTNFLFPLILLHPCTKSLRIN